MFFQHILVPLDGSPFAEAALPWAVSIARRAGGRIELLNVREEAPPAGYAEYLVGQGQDWVETAEAEARAYLDHTAARLSDRLPGRVQVVVEAGRPAARIADYCARSGAGLIVMATHGHGAVSRAWLGSVADDLVRRAPSPLLLARPGNERADLSADPVLRRVLVALDGSDRAEEALDLAVPLGMLFEASYTLLRAIELLPQIGGAFMADTVATDYRLLAQERSAAESYLSAIAERLRRRELGAQFVVVDGSPPTCILDYAERHETDLIVLSTRGLGGLQRLLLGSTADKVIRGAHVPVLVTAVPAP